MKSVDFAWCFRGGACLLWIYTLAKFHLGCKLRLKYRTARCTSFLAILLSCCNLFHRFGLEVDDVAINVIQPARKKNEREKNLSQTPDFAFFLSKRYCTRVLALNQCFHKWIWFWLNATSRFF